MPYQLISSFPSVELIVAVSLIMPNSAVHSIFRKRDANLLLDHCRGQVWTSGRSIILWVNCLVCSIHRLFHLGNIASWFSLELSNVLDADYFSDWFYSKQSAWAFSFCTIPRYQLSAVGSIPIPQLVLVLGMCFFAGGTRFSEQGFGSS